MATAPGTNVETPSISVVLSITPPEYSHLAGQSVVPNLSITATLAPSAPRPVTIMTWPTIFNPRLALRRRNFIVQDITHDPPIDIRTEITKGPKRPAFRRQKGTHDEKYYVTLYPGQEFVTQESLNIIKRTDRGSVAHIFQPGNTYTLGISVHGSKLQSKIWWWGTADEILDEVGGPRKDVSGLAGPGDIVLSAEAVHFKILDP